MSVASLSWTALLGMLLVAGSSRGGKHPSVLLEQKNDDCQCTFKDACSCEAALTFMECLKDTCNSGHCNCIEPDGTNHFSESCAAMSKSCPDVGLQCTGTEATCSGKVVNALATSVNASSDRPSGYMTQETHDAKMKDYRSYSHQAFAFGTVSTIMVLCATVALVSSSNALVRKHTWGTLDWVVVTFLAVMWFHVVLDGLTFYGLIGGPRMIVHALLAIAFLLVGIFGSWHFRDDKYNLDIFNAIATPMLMFCSTGYVQTVMKAYTPRVLDVFLTLLALACYHVIQCVIVYYVIAPKRGWGSGMEAGVYGGALAGGFVIWLHMVVSGTFQTFDPPHNKPPSKDEAFLLVGESFMFIAVAVIGSPLLARLKEKTENYWKGFGYDMLGHFILRLPHFACAMAFSHLIVDNSGFPPGDITSHLLLALVSTAIGVLMIFICAYVPALKDDTSDAKEMSAVFLQLGGFMAAIGWVHLMFNSINMMLGGEGREETFVHKITITAVLSAVVFPVYVLYIKPLVLAK